MIELDRLNLFPSASVEKKGRRGIQLLKTSPVDPVGDEERSVLRNRLKRLSEYLLCIQDAANGGIDGGNDVTPGRI